MKYLYVIEKADDGSYSAFVPDLPGCTTSAESIDELHTNMSDAVSTYLDVLREDGLPIPQPTTSVAEVEAA